MSTNPNHTHHYTYTKTHTLEYTPTRKRYTLADYTLADYTLAR